MSDEGEQFDTAVAGISGFWPTTPRFWSYSSLNEAEECPRRWMLSRAAYPDVWQRSGYPVRPTAPTLMGSAIHRVLEHLLRALHSRGCESVLDSCAVEILRETGGYSELIRGAIATELEPLEGNPRARHRIPDLRAALLKRLPEIRQRVQAVMSRTELVGGHERDSGGAGRPERRPLGDGSHPEIELRVDGLRFVGVADLISIADGRCVIKDYKSGQPADKHADQLRLYALLWSRDETVNPNGLPVDKLIVSYATRDEVVETPTGPALDALAGELEGRIDDVESKLILRAPPAYPSREMCELCSVRHLCEEYWQAPGDNAAVDTSSETGDFVDCEGEIVRRNGSRSWLLSAESEPGHALLRTADENPGFKVGDSVRVLGAAFGRDDDSSDVTLTMTQSSEVFVVAGRP